MLTLTSFVSAKSLAHYMGSGVRATSQHHINTRLDLFKSTKSTYHNQGGGMLMLVWLAMI